MRLRVLLVSVLAGLALPAADSVAQVEPATPATSFTAVLRIPGGAELVAWQAPEEFAARPLSGHPLLGGTYAHAGSVVYHYAQTSPASVLTRTFAARPDAFPEIDQLRGPTDFVLAEARRGALKLQPAGAAAYQVKLFAPASKCAGFGSGTIDLRLRRTDLLPLRVLERHGTIVARDLTLTYRSVNKPLPASTFEASKLTRPYREDKGFVRSSPAAGATHLSYLPLLPRSLPAGFTLAVSGWAKRSAATGAEGSIPPARELFAAVYQRGSEHIDLTQRLAPVGGWAADPFGIECVRQFTEVATIGSARGVYAASPYTTPHLYWRSGRLLYTLSGPFPKNQLLAIARSLTPIA